MTTQQSQSQPHMSNVDPITFQVLWSRLIAIADEMAVALEKTAFSHVVRDNHDYACAVYNADGEMMAEATHCTPGQIGAMTRVMHQFLDVFPADTLSPGDVLITNDPWFGSGHTPDIFIASPAFLGDQLIGFAANSAHHVDIGGRLASPDTREVYEEGLIIPISKLFVAGEPNRDLFSIVERNVRMPDKVIGDLRAQAASNHVGGRRLAEMMQERGLQSLTDLSSQILAHTEASMRAVIAEAPDGVYTCDLELGNRDRQGNPLHICLKLEISGDRIHADFTGTSAQVDLPVNAVYNITYAYVVFGVKCALHPHIPNNVGCYRPFTVTAPEGSILNATYPAPCMWRTDIVYNVAEAIFVAIAQKMPDKVFAPCGTYPLWLPIFAGLMDDGRPFVQHFNAAGGQGAGHDRDGASTTVYPANLSNTPIELLEIESPLICDEKFLIQDSGGPGEFRGGLGQEVVLRNGGVNPIAGTIIGGRYDAGAPGLLGAKSGSKGHIQINDDPPFTWHREISLAPGDRLTLRYPGGGGFGDPASRDPSRIESDLQEGLVTKTQVSEAYGK